MYIHNYFLLQFQMHEFKMNLFNFKQSILPIFIFFLIYIFKYQYLKITNIQHKLLRNIVILYLQFQINQYYLYF